MLGIHSLDLFSLVIFLSLSFSSPTANKNRIRDAYKRLIILNHPDRGKSSKFDFLSLKIFHSGGSPYIAAKINEAKDFFESGAK